MSSITKEIFAIPLPQDGKGTPARSQGYLVYAPRRRAAFLTNAATVNALTRLQEANGCPLSEDETRLLALCEQLGLTGEGDLPVSGLLQDQFKPHEVTLFLTTQCSLRCIYCYANGGETPHASMSLETAKRGIDFVCRNALETGKSEFGIGYHGGGEPSSHWRVLTQSFAYAQELAREKGLRVYGSMATNAMLTPRQREWVIRNFNGVNVSLDGLPGVQDRQRPRPDGGPSSPVVFETLKAFDHADFPYGVRITVTAQSVDQLAEGVSWLLEHYNPRQVQVEPVYVLGRGRQDGLAVDPEGFIAAFRQASIPAQRKGVDFYYSAARLDTLADRFCQSCGEGFSLTPQGLVSACYEVPGPDVEFAPRFIFGEYDERAGRYRFDEQKLAELRAHNVEEIPWCRGCYVKWHCGGDCLYKSQHTLVDGQFAGDPRCEITRALTTDQILAKIFLNGGVYWKDTAPPSEKHDSR